MDKEIVKCLSAIWLAINIMQLTSQVVYPKTDDQRGRLNDAIKGILLFKNVDQVLFFLFDSYPTPSLYPISLIKNFF